MPQSMMAASSCPKCGAAWPIDKPLPTTECPACGVIFAKYYRSEEEKRRRQAEETAVAAKKEKAKADKVAKAAAKAEADAAAATPEMAPPKSRMVAACAACGGIVAYDARTCPHCGAAGPRRPRSKGGAVIFGGALVALAFALVRGCSNSDRPMPPSGAAVMPPSSASLCPDIKQGAIDLPPERSGNLATLLNAADVLNARMGVCVLEGGWSSSSRMYYLTVQEPGKRPEIRRYDESALRGLAHIGERAP